MSNVPSGSSSSPSSDSEPLLGSTWFSDIVRSPCFVDKSLLVKAVLEDTSRNILITAPRRFGKSVNLDMLRRFFAIDEENSRSTFSKLKIKDHPKIIDQHCGKYAVLWVDLSRFAKRIDSYKSAIVAIRRVIHFTYLQYKNILVTSNELDDDEQKLCQLWCDKVQHENLSEGQVGVGIEHLASCLHKHFKTSLVLLVDEFDAICRKAMYKVNQKELDHIIFFYFQLFSLVVKTDKSTRMPYLYRAIFTGITSVTCTDPSGLNNVSIRKFLECSRYVDYYGILLDEFDSLLDKPAYSELRCQRDDVLYFYNGYTYGDRKILCTYSVVNYLCEDGRDPNLSLGSYWCNSADKAEFSNAWRKSELRLLLQNMVNGGQFNVPAIKKISTFELAALHRTLTSDSESQVSESDVDVFLTYLQQLGYLGIVYKTTRDVILKVPNEEIREEFASVLLTSFLDEYNFEYSILGNCADHLDRLIGITDEMNIQEAFSSFKEDLKTACQRYLVSEFLNEATLEHLIFAILLITKFIPVSQVLITKSLSDNRYAKKPELCFFKRNTGIIIELKFGAGGTAESAVEQIKTNKYCEIFTNGQIKGVERTAYVGIHLNTTDEKLNVSLAYTRNLAMEPVLL